MTTAASGAEPAVADHWRSAWSAALDAVEVDVADAELLLDRLHRGAEPPAATPVEDWVAPALLGPIPREFADRARALLARHETVGAQLADAMVLARTQHRGLSKLNRAESAPVFVDTAF